MSKHTRTKLPEGTTHVRNASTGEVKEVKSMSEDIKIKFDCNGFNAPEYSCSKSGDNSGYYVQSTDYDTLAQQVAELRAALETIKKHQQSATPSGFEFSTTWQIANKALAETDKE